MYFCIYFCAARANEMSYVPEKKKKRKKLPPRSADRWARNFSLFA